MCAAFATLGRLLGSGRGRYGVLLAAAIGAAVWIAWLVSLATGPGLLDRAGNVKGGDFVLFYAAGKIVAAHQTDHLYDPDLQEQIEHGLTGERSGRHGLINPPFFALPFVPLAALPYLAAFALWSALGIALLMGTLRLVGRLDAAPWVLAFVPVWAAISYGQNSLLSLFILAAVYVLLRHGHDRIAGAVLGCLLYKPQLVVLLAALLLLDRRWRALAGLGATAVLLAAVALALSVPATLAYLALGRSFATMLGERGFPTAKMHSLYSFFVLLLPGHLSAAAALALVSSLAVLALVRLRQPPYAADTLDRWYAAAIWGTVLVSPHVPLYDLSLLVLPALLVRPGTQDEATWRGGIAAVWAATILSQPLAELTRAAGGPSLQLSVPAIAAAGYCLLGTSRPPGGSSESQKAHARAPDGKAGQRT
jgi:alpha-1,2-mannosyltransferase